MTAPFDFAPLLAPGTPAPAAKWKASRSTISSAATTTPKRAGRGAGRGRDHGAAPRGPDARDLRANSGPLGYRPLREFLSSKLKGHAAIECSPDEILITSGSLQGLDLVNTLLLGKGDTVLIEKETYGGALTRLAKFGVNIVGIPLDNDGMRMDALKAKLEDLKAKGVTPKYIYTIPTVQNPTGSIMPESAARS